MLESFFFFLIFNFELENCLVKEFMIVFLPGCDPRLELKGKKGGGDDDDDRDDDDDDDDHSGKHKDVCKAKSWNPPVIDFRSSSKPKIKFCHKKGVESCSLVGARYSGFVKWRNITNFKQTFWDMKIKKDIVLQVSYVRFRPRSINPRLYKSVRNGLYNHG